MMWHYVEPGTGRPIASWRRKIYYLDDPKQLAFMKEQPTGVWYLRKSKVTGTIERYLEQVKGPLPTCPEVTAESARAVLPGLREKARNALETQNEAGVWVRDKVANFMGSIGAGFAPCSPRLRILLEYIEAVRTTKGELKPQYRGRGILLQAACPEADWYELQWEKNAQ